MRRALLLCISLAAFTWLEYEFFPGHTYLESDTQIYLPMLERLDTPGFLSRDLVATHPDVAYTIYDEVTLLLHEVAHLEFRTALTVQQLFSRGAAMLGIFLLALSCGVTDVAALGIAALLNLGVSLAGPAVSLVDREALPYAFAIGLTLLAAGLIARHRPLLAGLAGGFGLLYDAVIAAPFWLVIVCAFAFDRHSRRLLRPALPVALVFALLLANLAQLQPGVVERQEVFTRISEPLAALDRYRTPFVWVPLWASAEIWHYLAIFICGLWATARVWQVLNRQMRWFLLALPLVGLLSVPCSAFLLDRFRWAFIPQIQPARALLYAVAFASLACSVAAAHAARARRVIEAFLWLIPVLALPVNTRVLDLFDFPRFVHLQEARDSAGVSKEDRKAIIEVAHWAEGQTWGSSMFFFPDAGHERYPGIFRAESRRALWVDWYSGRLVPDFESFAVEWWQRWHDDMADGFSPQRLENMLSLPVDYYVLKRANELRDMRTVFHNQEFVVYDAIDLRNAQTHLRLSGAGARG